MPVYFGISNPDKVMHLLKKSLSMICTGTTKRFEEKMVLEVLPKLQTTLIVELFKNKKIISTKLLRLFLHLHRLFQLCLSYFPNVKKDVEDKVKAFVGSSENRHKNVCANLGDMLAL